MFCNNAVQLVANILFYLPAYFVYKDDSLSRIAANPNDLRDVIMIGVSGAVGQIFIYLTISLFNSYVLTVMTTSRKLFSVVLSSFAFNHKFTTVQWSGAAVVMIATVVELITSRRRK